MNDALGTYRFHEAANRIYDFFWGEFCDWYLELIKPRLNSDNAQTAAQPARNLVSLFEGCTALASPLMPFITEEIWQAVYDGKPPYEVDRAGALSASRRKANRPCGRNQMSILQDLIVSVRNLRAELKVEPKQKVPIEVFADAAIRTLIEQNRNSR